MEHARGALQKIMTDALRHAAPDDAATLAGPLVCGAAVAAKTRACGVTGGVLAVEVHDAAWKSQLADLAPRYLAALQQLAPGQVKRIEFLIAGGEERGRKTR